MQSGLFHALHNEVKVLRGHSVFQSSETRTVAETVSKSSAGKRVSLAGGHPTRDPIQPWASTCRAFGA